MARFLVQGPPTVYAAQGVVCPAASEAQNSMAAASDDHNVRRLPVEMHLPTDRDQNTAEAVEPPVPGGRRVTYGGIGLPDGLRGDLLERRVHVHLQFHGNATCDRNVFLSNGVEAAPATLYALKTNIEAASTTAAAGGPVLRADVYDAPGDCALRGTGNMQMRFASGLPHASICAQGNVSVGLRGLFTWSKRRDARRAPKGPIPPR